MSSVWGLVAALGALLVLVPKLLPFLKKFLPAVESRNTQSATEKEKLRDRKGSPGDAFFEIRVLYLTHAVGFLVWSVLDADVPDNLIFLYFLLAFSLYVTFRKKKRKYVLLMLTCLAFLTASLLNSVIEKGRGGVYIGGLVFTLLLLGYESYFYFSKS